MPPFGVLSLLCHLLSTKRTTMIRDAIHHCPDGLHTIAFELYSLEEYRASAVALYQELATIGHPESASELADHYEDQGAIQQSLSWRLANYYFQPT